MAQHEERPHGERHNVGDHHGHDHGHHHAHDHADVPYDRAQVEHEITADRQWMFDKFVQWTTWNVVLIFLILALLALTQT